MKLLNPYNQVLVIKYLGETLYNEIVQVQFTDNTTVSGSIRNVSEAILAHEGFIWYKEEIIDEVLDLIQLIEREIEHEL